MANFRKLPLWLRWWGLLAGALTLFWIPIEDTTLTGLRFVSAAWGIWLAGWSYQRGWLRIKRFDLRWQKALAGGSAGLLMTLSALILVLIKAGLHGHGFLDFSFYQLEQMVYWTPVGVLLGALGGWMLAVVLHR